VKHLALPQLLQIGSFQTGTFWESEEPLREVWSRVAQIGVVEHVAKRFRATRVPVAQATDLVLYAALRCRQAVEFRNAATAVSGITSPLLTYYSFMNLLRGCYALREEKKSIGHGLKLRTASKLFDCAASVESGTFADYLHTSKMKVPKKYSVTLGDCLRHIVEIRDDYRDVFGEPSLVDFVRVRAYINGQMFFDIVGHDGDMDASVWEERYPQLAGICHVVDGTSTLAADELHPEYDDVAQLVSSLFETNLNQTLAPSWFVTRQSTGDLLLPRLAYYYVAVFILGSLVRYETEHISAIANEQSESGWLISRFLRAAERYYPQLALIWLGGGECVYF